MQIDVVACRKPPGSARPVPRPLQLLGTPAHDLLVLGVLEDVDFGLGHSAVPPVVAYPHIVGSSDGPALPLLGKLWSSNVAGGPKTARRGESASSLAPAREPARDARQAGDPDDPEGGQASPAAGPDVD